MKIVGGPSQTSGVPDIVGCYKGHFVAFEVKEPTKASNVSERQRLTMSRIKRAGGVAEVVTSTRDALDFLDDLSSLLR